MYTNLAIKPGLRAMFRAWTEPAAAGAMKHLALSALSLGLALGLTQTAFAETLKKPGIDKLAMAWQNKTPPDFSTFLAQAAKAHPALKASVKAYKNKAPLAADDLVNISRLLGLYNRLHNQQAAISAMKTMVALRTMRGDLPQHENPAIIEFGKLIESMAKDFGLTYRNVDNRVFEVTLPGKGKEEFGILTHADVVPVVVEEWVLDDGTRLDPFTLTRVGDYLYGRGTLDDKGSIAAVLYAMKTVKESGVPLDRSIRLMIETTEETGGDGIKYYQQRTTLPEFNVVLDSKYPAVVAEKGNAYLKVFFPVQAADGKATAITAMGAAASGNTVPQTATVKLEGGDLAAIAATLEAATEAFIKKYETQGGPFAINIYRSSDSVNVKLTGSSAHGARPEDGVNSLPRLTLLLQESGIVLADNHYSRAVKYLNDLYGIGYLGEKMGVGYTDDFMGPLTMSPTLIREKDGRLEVTANVRMPRGSTPEKLTQAVAGKINAWAAANQTRVEIDHKQSDWMARDPKGAWLSTLLGIFGDTTGLEAKPVPTAGSTTAKLMPNAINFGPVMPGKKSTAHFAKEYKEVADLDMDMQMVTEMLVRIGNLKQMQ